MASKRSVGGTFLDRWVAPNERYFSIGGWHRM